MFIVKENYRPLPLKQKMTKQLIRIRIILSQNK